MVEWMARIRRFVPALGVVFGTAWMGAVACSTAPDLPPTVGGCDAQADQSCLPRNNNVGVGGATPADGAPSPVDAADAAQAIADADLACGIETALAPPSPACAPCIDQLCCSQAATCAADVECAFAVQLCAGCSSGACVANCSLTLQGITTSTSEVRFTDLSGCLRLNCPTECPTLQTIQTFVDP
jgi:hypothetical protein